MRCGCFFVIAIMVMPESGLRAADTMLVKPNIVILLADDLGWGDISAHGGSIPTPTIDRLCNQGVELRNFMGWCVCSPTRAMLLTGRHPFRVGTGPETGGELDKGETTIAEGFRANGYRTGVFGKWHNGADPDTPEFRAAYAEAFKDRPNKTLKGGLGVNEHGFDEAWVYYGGGPDHFTRQTSGGRGPVSWWHNREHRPRDIGYTDDLITRQAVEFIRDNKDRPFFCYVPFNNVHAPMQAKESDLLAVGAKVTDKDKRVYAAMTQALDKYVADILAELDKHNLRDNTILVFTSDNGATLGGSNLPFRGGKHTVFEGGTHLPTVIHWPQGGLFSGKAWNGLCGALDMFPTLMAMAGLKMPETRPLDGKNIWPALRDNTASPVESYYWSWHNEDVIRTADWRMHRFVDRVELYDIVKDIGETKNVADKNPETVTALTNKMNDWVESLGVALSHLPPKALNAKPAPEGDVLEISLTVADQAKPKDTFVVQFARWEGNVYATDYIEYDLAVAPGGSLKGFFYTPFKGNDDKITLHFKRGEGVDQFGREQIFGPEPNGGVGVWEHRIIGLASFGPGIAPGHALVFKGAKPGNYKVYIDNLRIRHADGTTTPLWTNGKDTRTVKVQVNEMFQDLKVRIVDANDVSK